MPIAYRQHTAASRTILAMQMEVAGKQVASVTRLTLGTVHVHTPKTNGCPTEPCSWKENVQVSLHTSIEIERIDRSLNFSALIASLNEGSMCIV